MPSSSTAGILWGVAKHTRTSLFRKSAVMDDCRRLRLRPPRLSLSQGSPERAGRAIRVPDPVGNHGEQRELATSRSGPQHRPAAGQLSTRRQKAQASQAEDSAGRRRQALAVHTGNMAEASWGAARHTRAWSAGGPPSWLTVVGWASDGSQRGRRPSVRCGRVGPSLGRPRPLDSGQ